MGETRESVHIGQGSGSTPSSSPSSSAPARRCNSHEALCARPLDEVVLAGAHNVIAVGAGGKGPAGQVSLMAFIRVNIALATRWLASSPSTIATTESMAVSRRKLVRKEA